MHSPPPPDSLNAWKKQLLYNPGAGGPAGCWLVLLSFYGVVAGVAGVVMVFGSMPGADNLAEVLALPAAGVGLLVFHLLAPAAYAARRWFVPSRARVIGWVVIWAVFLAPAVMLWWLITFPPDRGPEEAAALAAQRETCWDTLSTGDAAGFKTCADQIAANTRTLARRHPTHEEALTEDQAMFEAEQPERVRAAWAALEAQATTPQQLRMLEVLVRHLQLDDLQPAIEVLWTRYRTQLAEQGTLLTVAFAEPFASAWQAVLWADLLGGVQRAWPDAIVYREWPLQEGSHQTGGRHHIHVEVAAEQTPMPSRLTEPMVVPTRLELTVQVDDAPSPHRITAGPVSITHPTAELLPDIYQDGWTREMITETQHSNIRALSEQGREELTASLSTLLSQE